MTNRLDTTPFLFFLVYKHAVTETLPTPFYASIFRSTKATIIPLTVNVPDIHIYNDSFAKLKLVDHFIFLNSIVYTLK